ncbi:hypothetical protein ACTMU2_15745 [Cupriavidus basilensis]
MSRSVDEVVSRYLDQAHRANGVDIPLQRTGYRPAQRRNLKAVRRQHRPCRKCAGRNWRYPERVGGFAHLGITDPAGVRVDLCGQTAIAGIFATGDIASQPHGAGFGRVETWANAQDHAINLVKNLLGRVRTLRVASVVLVRPGTHQSPGRRQCHPRNACHPR